MRGVVRARRMLRNFRRIFQPSAAILIYHRVMDVPSDPFRLAVSPDHFASQVEYIRSKYPVLRLSEFVEGFNKRNLPHRSVVITFDDGYQDNFSQAWPILSAYDVPASIFVTTEGIHHQHEFWWDVLERIIFSTPNLPSYLKLSINGTEHRWPVMTVEQRECAFWTMHGYLRVLLSGERDRVLREIALSAGVGLFVRNKHVPMKQDELLQIAQSGLIDIGAHTRTHPVLSCLDEADQCDEIIRGKDELEHLTGRKIEMFSYPFGKPEDYSPQTVEIVRLAGFQAALTTVHGAVDVGDDLFQLKRCEVNNWNRNELAAKLESFFYV